MGSGNETSPFLEILWCSVPLRSIPLRKILPHYLHLVPTKHTAFVVAYAMASQTVASSGIDNISLDSFVRGYHVYMDRWDPRNGEVLPLEREPTNPEDPFAVAIKRSGETVGHVPFNLAPIISAFLKRSCNKGLVEVTGNRVNRGAGYRL